MRLKSGDCGHCHNMMAPQALIAAFRRGHLFGIISCYYYQDYLQATNLTSMVIWFERCVGILSKMTIDRGPGNGVRWRHRLSVIQSIISVSVSFLSTAHIDMIPTLPSLPSFNSVVRWGIGHSSYNLDRLG